MSSDQANLGHVRHHPATDSSSRSRTPRSSRSLPHIRLVYVVVALVIVVFSIKFMQKAWLAHELSRQVAAEEQQVALVAQNNAQLRQNIRYYHTLRYVEDAASQQGYLRPGEQAVVVASVKSQAPPRAAQHPVPRPVRAVPVWQQWWNVFFGHSP